MGALAESDLRILLGDNYEKVMHSERTLEYKRINKVKQIPMPPNNITRFGGWMLIAVSVISILCGITIVTLYHDRNLIGTTLFSLMSGALMIFNANRVLIGLNYGRYRISGSIALLSNTIFVFPLISLYFSNTAEIVTLGVIIINIICLITWFWDCTDCID